MNAERDLKQAQNTQQQTRGQWHKPQPFRSSQLRDSSEKGFQVSTLLNRERLCLNWQICEGTENPNGENLNLGKTASLFSKKKMNPQSGSCHSRRNMCHGNSRGKMCHGKILMDSAQDENVQIDAKLNAIEQGNTYPSNEENSQHTRKKDGSLNPRGVWGYLCSPQWLHFGRNMKVSLKRSQESAAEMKQGVTEVQGSVTELNGRCVTQPSYRTAKQVPSNTVCLLLRSHPVVHFWDTVFFSLPGLLSWQSGFQELLVSSSKVA